MSDSIYVIPGTTPTIKIKIPDLAVEYVESIVFSLTDGKTILHVNYPSNVPFVDGYFRLGFTQKNTLALKSNYCKLQAQINFVGGSVTKTVEYSVFLKSTFFTYLEGNTAGNPYVEADYLTMTMDSNVFVNSLLKAPYIGEDDYWYVYDKHTDTFVKSVYSKGGVGVGIANIQINSQDHLIIMLTDNTTIDCGTLHGIPDGGTINQILKKHSNAPYDVEWADESGITKEYVDSSVSEVLKHSKQYTDEKIVNTEILLSTI